MTVQVGRSRSGDLFKRLAILVVTCCAVLILCAFHGIRESERSAAIIDGMIKNGRITGKYWRLVRSDNGTTTLTKYRRVVTLLHTPPPGVSGSDKFSFTAQRTARKKDQTNLWEVEAIHFHGSSAFKYFLSALSLLMLGFLCLRHFRWDKDSLSIRSREEP